MLSSTLWRVAALAILMFGIAASSWGHHAHESQRLSVDNSQDGGVAPVRRVRLPGNVEQVCTP